MKVKPIDLFNMEISEKMRGCRSNLIACGWDWERRGLVIMTMLRIRNVIQREVNDKVWLLFDEDATLDPVAPERRTHVAPL